MPTGGDAESSARFGETGYARFEHHLSIGDDNFLIDKVFHCPAEDIGFGRETALAHIRGCVFADMNMKDILQNNRSLIQIFSDEMGGAV